MSIIASLVSLALGVIFATAAVAQLRFTPTVAQMAQRLETNERRCRVIGGVQAVAAAGLIAGIVGRRYSVLGIINEASAGVLAIVMVAAVVTHLRHGDQFSRTWPALGLGLLSLVALGARLY